MTEQTIDATAKVDDQDDEDAGREYASADWKDPDNAVSATKGLLADLGIEIDCDAEIESIQEGCPDAAEELVDFLNAIHWLLVPMGKAIIVLDAESDAYEWRIGDPNDMDENESLAPDI